MNAIHRIGIRAILLAGMAASRVVAADDVLQPYAGTSVVGVDASTLTGKVMCGYQGWFNCEGDGAELGWAHWARNRSRIFGPGNLTVDLWPDTSEYTDGELFDTAFHYEDGRTAKVFSSHNRLTVLRHLKWMREYGIDGAFVQRFARDLPNDAMRHHKDKVLASVREGANREGRSYAVMYDLTGLPAGGTEIVMTDWNMLQGQMTITADGAYQRHKGRPVVALWGIGFNDKIKPRRYTLEECRSLVEFFKNNGCSVMIGAPTGWRTLERDALPDPGVHDILLMADVISPWTPGRYHDLESLGRHVERYWKPDVRWCRQRGVDYLPVIFPGFSWHHQKGGELGATPRLQGQFLWSQIAGAKDAGAEMIYVAMFDEVDEGTAIFKCTNNPPTGDGVPFLTYEGLPSDHYLWLAGQAGRLLRDEIPNTEAPPQRSRHLQNAAAP